MKMKKRFLVLMTLVSVLLLTVGCTQASTVPPVSPTEADEVANEVQVEPAALPLKELGYNGPELSDEPVTIRILRSSFDPYLEELFQGFYKEFTTAYPNITIEEDIVPFGELFQKIQTVAASGNPPDIYLVDGPFVKSYVYYDMLLPLDSYLTSEYMADILAPSKAEHSSDGIMYAMPMWQSASAMYFNKDIFTEAGVEFPPETDDPSQGWTWEQYLDAWIKLTKDTNNDGVPEIWGLAPSEFGPGGIGSNYYYEGLFIRSFGDPTADKESSAYKTWASINEDGNSVVGYINTPEAVAAMQFYQDIFQKYKVSPTAGIPSAFIDGKAATYIATDGIVGRIANNAPNLNYGVSPIPSGGTPFTHTGSMAWAISSKTQNPSEVVALLTYLCSTDNIAEIVTITGELPALESTYAKFEKYSQLPGSLFLNELKTIGQPRPVSPGYSDYQTIMDAAIKDIGLGADPTERLAKAEQELEELLAKFR